MKLAEAALVDERISELLTRREPRELGAVAQNGPERAAKLPDWRAWGARGRSLPLSSWAILILGRGPI